MKLTRSHRPVCGRCWLTAPLEPSPRLDVSCRTKQPAATEHWAEHPTMSRADFVDYLITMLWDGLSGAGLSGTERPVDMTPAIDAMRAADEH